MLLINPPLRHPEAVVPPLGIACLAAALREAGRIPAILDANALDLDEAAAAAQALRLRPSVVGLSVLYSSYPAAREITRRLKAFASPPLVIWGGPHATTCPEESLREGGADLCVIGEGEGTIRDLAPGLEKGPGFWRAVPGLAFREGEGVVRTPRRELLADIDSLPFPAYDLLPMDRYRTLRGVRGLSAAVLTSRGCPGKCIFCSRCVFGRTMRYRSVPRVMEEIGLLAKNHGVRNIAFIDDAFLEDRNRILDLCSRLVASGLGLSWRLGNGVRVDQVDAELLRKMREAGCTDLAFGVESGDDEVLKRIGKEITTDQARLAFRLAKEAGLGTIGFFQIGHPFDTVETMGKTIAFAIELDPDYAAFAVSTPLPGAALWEWARTRARPVGRGRGERIDIFSKKPHFVTENFTAGDVSRLYRSAYRRFYFRPRYLLRKIRSLRQGKDLQAAWAGLKYLVGI
jgi:radical SAM superfamily enzyme YgiQ (UPF0313 family)